MIQVMMTVVRGIPKERRVMSRKIQKLKRAIPFLLALWVLTACAGQDKPFSLVGDSNAPQEPVPDGSGSVPPPTIEGCRVHYNGQMQLKVSANPTGAQELEKLDARPIDIEPIPFIVEGNTITLHGDLFPDIILTRLSDSVDLRVSGVPGTSAPGTYDPATGAIEITGFQFGLEILNKGTLERFADGSEVLSGVNFTTGSVTATGNLNPITEVGAPFNASTFAVSLVLGLTLPDTFPQLSVLNNEIAGGALTARFDGTLDQLPENCVEGGGNPPPSGGSGAGTPPIDFSISDGSSTNTGTVDFGTALVLTKDNRGETILDCSEALNRDPKSKLITLKNTGAEELKIKVMSPADTDGDAKAPLCSGASEFVRGTLKAHGSASCDTVSVGGKLFTTTECTIPTGDDQSYLTFPLLYVPFNFVPPPEAPAPTTPPAEGDATGDATGDAAPPPPPQAPPDTGALLIEYNDGKTYSLSLVGRSEKDSSDSFRISKVRNGAVDAKEFRTNDVIKIPLDSGDPTPFTQTLALKNIGSDVWEEVVVTFPAENSVYTVSNLASTALPASGSGGPGMVQFDVVFDPGSGQVFSETMTITMVRAGSKTADNPQGTVATLNLTLNGTVGIPSLKGDVKFQIDFLAGKIDHNITAEPVESLDFRTDANKDQAPPPLDLAFADTAVETVKEVTLHVENKSVLQKSLEDRLTSLRILNARATYGTPGRKLVSGEGADLCNEPPNIGIPYDDGRMECSYFYFQISGDTPGRYDDDTGELTLPEINLRIENPYHSDIAGKWLPSNPGGNPSNILDTEIKISLTTLLLDDVQVGEGDEAIILVPDDRILKGDLSVKGKPMGAECPGDYPFILDHDSGNGTLEEKHPHIRCYLTSDERFMKGRAVSIRPDDINKRDVVLVGVGRFPPDTEDSNLPWFMGEGGGSRIYIAIQGRLFIE
jgi:hypothetical protein